MGARVTTRASWNLSLLRSRKRRETQQKQTNNRQTQQTPLRRQMPGRSPKRRKMRSLQQSPHARDNASNTDNSEKNSGSGEENTKKTTKRKKKPKARRMPTPKPVILSCPRSIPKAQGEGLATPAGRSESDPKPCSRLGPVLAQNMWRVRRAERTSS